MKMQTNKQRNEKSPFRYIFFCYIISLQIAIVHARERLSICEGNCNGDDDCSTGLRCYHKQPNHLPISPCSGQIHRIQNSYCIPRESSDFGNVQSVLQIEENNITFSECELGCIDDSNCENDLKCISIKDSQSLVGTKCDQHSSHQHNLNICINEGKLALGLCEGKCMTDGDCKDDLVCFRRNKIFAGITECSGATQLQSNFCIRNSNMKTSKYCTITCFTDGSCPKGYKCMNQDKASKYCNLEKGTTKDRYCIDETKIKEYYIHHKKQEITRKLNSQPTPGPTTKQPIKAVSFIKIL